MFTNMSSNFVDSVLNTGKESEELSKFLEKVNEIGSIICDLSASNKDTVAKGFTRADEYLAKMEKVQSEEEETKTVCNRTVLNKNILKDDGGSEIPNCSTMSPGDFIAAVEKDAVERASRTSQKTN